MTKKCLFCNNPKTFESKSHIIPESLGNDKYILEPGIVCDKCNSYFSSKIENEFCQKHFSVFEKVFYLKKTKKGKFPKINSENSCAERTDEETIHIMFKKQDASGIKLIYGANDLELRLEVKFELPEVDLTMMSRSLAKMGLESLYYQKGQLAFQEEFQEIADYARKAKVNQFIPFLYKPTHDNTLGINILPITITFDKTRSDVYYFGSIFLPKCIYAIPLYTNFNIQILKIISDGWKMILFDQPGFANNLSIPLNISYSCK